MFRVYNHWISVDIKFYAPSSVFWQIIQIFYELRAMSKISARGIEQKKTNKRFIISLHFVVASSSFSKKPIKLGLYRVIRWHNLRVLLPLYKYKGICTVQARKNSV